MGHLWAFGGFCASFLIRVGILGILGILMTLYPLKNLNTLSIFLEIANQHNQFYFI